MRSFIAIQIGQQVRARLARLASEIGSSGARGRPVSSHAIHLTLKFLGEVQAEQVPGILAALGKTARQFKAFTLQTQGLGIFPNPEHPRVLWAGLAPPNSIISLQKALEGHLDELGFAPDNRPFHSHLTLLRIKEVKSRHFLARLVQRNSGVSFGPVEVREIILFESLLKPGGAEYNVRGLAQLRPGPS